MIFLALLALVLSSGADHHHERFALLVVSGYGLIAVLALVLAWLRIFNRLLPYACQSAWNKGSVADLMR